MRKLSLSVIGMYLMMAHAFSQGPAIDSTGFVPQETKTGRNQFRYKLL